MKIKARRKAINIALANKETNLKKVSNEIGMSPTNLYNIVGEKPTLKGALKLSKYLGGQLEDYFEVYIGEEQQ
ncbi:hypothetical protein [Staphylococcus equorum]|uniref:hypothetical protein n=1 Tax=Staphylococcus equorum TaxID=246432 RepID=UPI00080642B8|nr:hypothetical protein [Staphylococcus equorum]ANQ64121.1 hypothetical protein AVJ22_05340 [Staphylococcus equorum]MDK9867844.1 hypothetical protein [Staphylococcus equorum]OEK70670.1 hypothetical protein AST02_04240 [Staphylococcus equorum]OIS50230.1 hypothetical protein A4A29_02425 [Staphylococcus equorum]